MYSDSLSPRVALVFGVEIDTVLVPAGVPRSSRPCSRRMHLLWSDVRLEVS